MVNTVHDLFYDLLELMVRNNVNEDMSRWTWAPVRFYTSPATTTNVAICRALLAFKNDLEVARSDFLDAVEENVPEHEKDVDRAALRLAWCEKIVAAALAGIPVLRELDDTNLLIHIERFKCPSLAPRPYTYLVGVNSFHDLQTLFPTLPSVGALNPDLVSVLERLLMCPRMKCASGQYLPTYVRIGFDIRTGGCFWLDGNDSRPVFAHFNLWSEWAAREESVRVVDGHVVHEEREKTKAELALDEMRDLNTVILDYARGYVHVERKRELSAGAGEDDDDGGEPSNKRTTTGEH